MAAGRRLARSLARRHARCLSLARLIEAGHLHFFFFCVFDGWASEVRGCELVARCVRKFAPHRAKTTDSAARLTHARARRRSQTRVLTPAVAVERAAARLLLPGAAAIRQLCVVVAAAANTVRHVYMASCRFFVLRVRFKVSQSHALTPPLAIAPSYALRFALVDAITIERVRARDFHTIN